MASEHQTNLRQSVGVYLCKCSLPKKIKANTLVESDLTNMRKVLWNYVGIPSMFPITEDQDPKHMLIATSKRPQKDRILILCLEM